MSFVCEVLDGHFAKYRLSKVVKMMKDLATKSQCNAYIFLHFTEPAKYSTSPKERRGAWKLENFVFKS